MKRWKNPGRWSFEQRKAVAAELEAHLMEVMTEAGQLNVAAAEKLKMAEDLLGRLVRYNDQDHEQQEELPF